MPRPKKEALSPQVGTVSQGRKRGNPEFVSSSFYVPKKVNFRFDKSLLTLKAEGFELDRSDILSVLMDRFSIAVDAAEAAEKEGDEMDLEAILATVTDASLADACDVSVLKARLRTAGEKTLESARALKEAAEMSGNDVVALMAQLKQALDENAEMKAQLKAGYEKVQDDLAEMKAEQLDRQTSPERN